MTTCTHWVEIDLLRGGEPMAVDMRGQNVASHYRILISRAEHRPRAMLLPTCGISSQAFVFPCNLGMTSL